ncbi:MAG: Mpo1-like protein [Wenzhouxiangellaceae bacterium]|nr:Mpo1-like protein [Wenzhouxiangellaceae bacterium]
MRSADSWLAEYGQSHQNPTNKTIHWICVPLILWTVTALVWSIPSPVEWLNWAVLMAVLAMAWYLALSPRLAIGIGAVLALCLGINAWVEATFATPLWLIAVIVFIAAWIGQFIGHHIEGKKPSFFKDLQFLLVGPAWLMGFIYRKMGWSY